MRVAYGQCWSLRLGCWIGGKQHCPDDDGHPARNAEMAGEQASSLGEYIRARAYILTGDGELLVSLRRATHGVHHEKVALLRTPSAVVSKGVVRVTKPAANLGYAGNPYRKSSRSSPGLRDVTPDIARKSQPCRRDEFDARVQLKQVSYLMGRCRSEHCPRDWGGAV